MHIEFIDLLRCPVAHADSWLVAAFTRMDGRMVLEGKLGCPVCNASYVVRDGVALLQADTIRDAPRGVARSGNELEDDLNDVNAATRVAAFLELTRPGSLALLAGTWARAAEAVAELAQARIISLNSPGVTHGSESVAELRCTGRIGLAERSLDGAALDAEHSTPEMLNEAARLLRPRGRVIASASASLPPQFRELARDENHLVAEYVGELVPLRR
jgi:uncharacterized protein YbaR (Trm112 family)